MHISLELCHLHDQIPPYKSGSDGKVYIPLFQRNGTICSFSLVRVLSLLQEPFLPARSNGTIQSADITWMVYIYVIPPLYKGYKVCSMALLLDYDNRARHTCGSSWLLNELLISTCTVHRERPGIYLKLYWRLDIFLQLFGFLTSNQFQSGEEHHPLVSVIRLIQIPYMPVNKCNIIQPQI